MADSMKTAPGRSAKGDKGRISTTTAGLRGALWDPAKLPPDLVSEQQVVTTADGASCLGVLYSRGAEQAAVMLMHPREYLAAHYLVPELLAGNVAVWVQAPRSIGNDIRLEHEIALYDVAAGVGFLRDRGYAHVALLGNSGGAGLFALYLEQCAAAPPERLARTPGGRPTRLEEAELPPADSLILVSPHPGQGKLLQACIDPSLTDEDDAFSVDPALSPFLPANGFRKPPESAEYSAEFVSRYRQAQIERVRRLDQTAREMIEVRQQARRRGKKEGGAALLARGYHSPILTIWRTDADLRCYDLSLDPSDRAYGSLWGPNPLVSNFGSIGFARVCTPDSWLSTWSGLSSNASLSRCLPACRLPTLLVEYTGDNSTFPADVDAIYASIAANDKARVTIRGNHHGRNIHPTEPNGQPLAGAAIRGWLAERAPEAHA